ncbi:MAG TPA: hypothetical protein VFM59_07485 [Salinimicrobium sp.]|nr:hypothetical protein [Salinimicrobium sp.]
MKTVDKKEVISSQSAEFIQQAETGKFLKLIPDTFVIKMENGNLGYAIRHLNLQDMILIDTTEKGAQKAVKKLVEEGYKIKGILLTHKAAVDNAYASLKTISEDAGGAPIFTHPVNTHDAEFTTKDINAKNNIFEHFSISVRDFPAKNGEAAVIYSEINDGMVFAGNSAIGEDFESDKKGFNRPDLGSENKNLSLAESWRTYMWEFSYFFPHQGKPGFNLSEGEQKDIIIKLGQTGYSGGGNPSL